MPSAWTTRLSALTLFGVVACAPALAEAELSRLIITVRVYQTAGLTAAVEQRTLEEARTVLGIAKVDVTWLDCSGGRAAACGVPPRGSELLLKMVAAGDLRRNGLDTLGSAQLARDGTSGLLATVNVRRVARLAVEARVDQGLLLGRVSAHEIGHLLIGANAHSEVGLMRPGWTVDQIRKRRSVDWRFTSENLAAMRRSTSVPPPTLLSPPIPE